MRRLIGLLLLGLLLAACAPVAPGSESTSTPAVAGPADTAAPATAGVSTAVPSTADLPATLDARGVGEVVVSYVRGGGLAGELQLWTIYADGTMTLADSPEAAPLVVGQVTPEQVAALVTGLDSLGFFQMQNTYGANDNCADCFTYLVTVVSGGVAKSVTTHDAASDAPPELTQALELIQALLNTTT